MNRTISILSALLIATASVAQTLSGDTINRTVLVESTYNPIVVSAVKRNFIPDEVEPSMNRAAIVYADKAMPIARLQRTALPVEKVGVAQSNNTPGYLHLGYGGYNDLDALAAYRFQFNENNTLMLKVDADGWAGWYDKITSRDDDEDWYSYLYRGNLDARYRLNYGSGELGVGLLGGYSTFNYLDIPLYRPSYRPSIKEPDTNQQAERLSGNFYVKGTINERFRYDADATYTYSAQQNYLGEHALNSENHLHTQAAFGADFGKYGVAILNLKNDLMTYSLDDFEAMNYITVTPEWSVAYKQFRFATGVNLDFSNQAYARFKASPSCSINYTSKNNFDATLLLDGGHQLPTYSYLESLSPYWVRTAELRSSYTYLNALLSGNVRLFEGFHLHVNGGYRIIGSALFETAVDMDNIRYTGFANRDAHLAHATTKLSYNYKQQFSCFTQATYNHWMVEGERDILARAPQLDAQAGVKAHIFGGLSAHSNFRYVLFTATDSELQRETSIIDWNLGLQYALNNHWSFYLDGHNLLNHQHQLYTGYPTQGISAMAGAAFKF